MYIGLHVKYLLLLTDFNETWILSADFLKKFDKICSRTSSGSWFSDIGSLVNTDVSENIYLLLLYGDVICAWYGFKNTEAQVDTSCINS